MKQFIIKEHYTMEDLAALTRFLRSPGGCPWDSVQTHESVRRNFIEEVYEVCEAIDQDDPVHMCEELGDVLYQVMFHADMEREAGRFDIDTVCDEVCKKLVARHPFLFANETASDAEDALDRWDNVKRNLNGHRTHTQAMDSVSRTLPSLWRAEKLLGKAEKAGLRRENAMAALAALEEETARLRKALEAEEDAAEAYGDLLFAAAGVARQAKLDPEDALNEASERFIRRFEAIEQASAAAGMQEIPAEMLEKCWRESE